MDIFNSKTIFEINVINQKSKNKSIGVVAGIFDIFNASYCLYLQDAKNYSDILVVLLHIDPSIEKSHKPTPIQSVEEREIQLRACKYVDYIITYATENDLNNILLKLNPDVRLLGNEYFDKDYTGKELTLAVHWHNTRLDWNTENLKNRIYSSFQKKNSSCSLSELK
jgi:glycerol-3-phosphate cytidylyltransferase